MAPLKKMFYNIWLFKIYFSGFKLAYFFPSRRSSRLIFSPGNKFWTPNVYWIFFFKGSHLSFNVIPPCIYYWLFGGFFEKFLTYTLSTQKFQIRLWKTQFQHRNKHAISPYFVLFNVNWKPFRCPFVRLNSQITIKIILQYFLTSRSRKFLKWDFFETFFIIFWTWLPKFLSFSMENTVFHGMS